MYEVVMWRIFPPLLSICTASEHLQEERRKLDARLQLLLEERDLIDKHLAEQRVKQAEICKAEAALQERSALVSTTLHNLQVMRYAACRDYHIGHQHRLTPLLYCTATYRRRWRN
jgi:hypothetical protein